MKNKITQFNNQLIKNSEISLEKDVPIGMVMGSDKVFLKYSLSSQVKGFPDVETLMDFVIENKD